MLRKMGQKLERIEDEIFEGHSAEVVRDISNAKQEIINFRRIVRPQRVAFRDLERAMDVTSPEELDVYFDDVIDASERIWDTLENYKEIIEGLESTNESVLSHNVNDILRVLTSFSVIVLPLTLVASLFGMNVLFPGEDTTEAFWVILGFMAVDAAWRWWPSSGTAAGSEQRRADPVPLHADAARAPENARDRALVAAGAWPGTWTPSTGSWRIYQDYLYAMIVRMVRDPASWPRMRPRTRSSPPTATWPRFSGRLVPGLADAHRPQRRDATSCDTASDGPASRIPSGRTTPGSRPRPQRRARAARHRSCTSSAALARAMEGITRRPAHGHRPLRRARLRLRRDRPTDLGERGHREVPHPSRPHGAARAAGPGMELFRG